VSQLLYINYHQKKNASLLVTVCYTAVRINNYASAIKVANMKISIVNGSHHVPTTKLTLFTVNKDEWDTKEGTGKSMKNALYV